MKTTLFLLTAGFLALGMGAFAQSSEQPAPPAQGRGRGGAPYAWNDKNKDGICDVTGKAVGQGRGQMGCRGGRGGRGQSGAMGRGPANNAAPVQPAPQPQAK
ncbi:MAG: hypothetical protein HY822_09500 [Acidobacteria bacterium]|nr:hypothetical protein [Acidobacteriota bacterium]